MTRSRARGSGSLVPWEPRPRIGLRATVSERSRVRAKGVPVRERRDARRERRAGLLPGRAAQGWLFDGYPGDPALVGAFDKMQERALAAKASLACMELPSKRLAPSDACEFETAESLSVRVWGVPPDGPAQRPAETGTASDSRPSSVPASWGYGSDRVSAEAADIVLRRAVQRGYPIAAGEMKGARREARWITPRSTSIW